MTPNNKVKRIDGKDIVVFELKVRHIKPVATLLLPIFKKVGKINVIAITELAVEHYEDLLTLAVEMTDVTSEVLQELRLIDFVDLLVTAWELNKDFFSELMKRLPVPQHNTEETAEA